MTIKLLGAVLIICGCGSFGFLIGLACKKEEKALRQMLIALEYIKSELQYRLTPLPELCRQASGVTDSPVREFFNDLASVLSEQMSSDAAHCVRLVLNTHKDIPEKAKTVLLSFGRSLGRFDADGQISSIDTVMEECKRYLIQLTSNQQTRLRTYKTLGLCAGAAIAILFI